MSRNVGAFVFCSVFVIGPVSVLASNGGKAEEASTSSDIDKAKCSDPEKLQEQIEGLIKRAITEQQSSVSNTKPALSYDLDPSSPRSSRVTAQAREVSKALAAAIDDPQNAARNASTSLNGDGKRRAGLKVYSQCRNEAIKTVIEQNKYATNIGQCAQGESPLSTGLVATQIFQTSRSVEDVRKAFVHKMVEPSSDTTVLACQSPCKSYSQSMPAGFPNSGSDYMLRVRRDYGFGYNMSNETALRISKIPLCNSEIHLVSALSLPQRKGDNGFDSSTLIGVVAQVGGKTLVFGSFVAQASRSATSAKPMPMTFLEKYDRYIGEIFARYDTVASIVGSSEHPVNGLLGGRPGLIPMERLPAPGSKSARPAAQ